MIYEGTAKKSYGNSLSREPNESAAMQGILKEVSYPVGAIATFEYESNRGLHAGKVKYGNGMRLKQAVIKKNKNDSNPIVRDYKYGSLSNGQHTGYGLMKMDPTEVVYDGEETVYWIVNKITANTASIKESYRKRVYNSDYSGDMAFFASMSVFYPLVTEYINQEQRIDFYYEDKYRNFDYSTYGYLPSGMPSNYASYGANNSGIFGFTEAFSHCVQPHVFSMTSKKFGRTYSFWQNTNLIEKNEYVKSGNEFKLVKQTKNTYQSTVDNSIKGLKINQYIYLSGIQLSDAENLRKLIFTSTDLPEEVYYADYYLTIGRDELVRTDEKIFDTNLLNSTTTTTEYAYNDYSLPKEITVINSDKSVHQNATEYIVDVPAKDRNLVLNNMIKANLLNYAVKKTNKTNQSIANILKIEYKDLYQIGKISSQKRDYKEEARVVYHNYDSYNNPVYITKDDVTKIVYIWSYIGQYPIAEIKNATFSEVKQHVDIEALSKKTAPTNTDMENIRNLNSKLPNIHISTFTYEPLVGMLTATDPSGITTYYEYDPANRLGEIYLKEGTSKRILQKNTYNYIKNLFVKIERTTTNIIFGENIQYKANIPLGSNDISVSWNAYNATGSKIGGYPSGSTFSILAGYSQIKVVCTIIDNRTGETAEDMITVYVDIPSCRFENIVKQSPNNNNMKWSLESNLVVPVTDNYIILEVQNEYYTGESTVIVGGRSYVIQAYQTVDIPVSTYNTNAKVAIKALMNYPYTKIRIKSVSANSVDSNKNSISYY